MTTRDDLDRKLDAFLADGPTELPESSYYAVRDRTEATRQRVVIGPWRLPTMNRLVPIGLGVAAVVVALAIGTQFLGTAPTPGVGGPAATPSPTPSAAPTATAEPSPSGDGSLPVGSRYTLAAGAGNTVPMSVAISAPGWIGEDGILTKGNIDTDGVGLVVYPEDLGWHVYGDPCSWSSTSPDAPATTVDAFAAALAAQATREASAPVDVTVDGHAGRSVTLHVPGDAVFGECDRGLFGTFGSPQDPQRYQQAPGQIDEVLIVDVDGKLAIIDFTYYADSDPAVLDELRAIVASLTFSEGTGGAS